ncbi:hypothetical protein HPB48_013732 [Haemaphysalis longicornis]|uniref:Uncharacterized protein n=1 Tax=Haemaphysalis longicornis TaxID=44386 RepID=A0A9J6FPJ5_HAELO|nr:hypothetical protein HPB48_013732 [Haemaphysalis longicornis]
MTRASTYLRYRAAWSKPHQSVFASEILETASLALKPCRGSSDKRRAPSGSCAFCRGQSNGRVLRPPAFTPPRPSGQLTYSCTGIRSSAELVDRFQPNRTAEGNLRLVFEDSVLEQIPPGLFNGLPVSALHFKNVVLTGRPSRTDPTPLRGLEGTLEKLVFSHNSTVPENWASFLVGMSALAEMVFFHMSGLSFASGAHSGLPSSLRKLHLVSSSIESADDYWLSSLVNLETLLLRHVILSTFPRTVLPTTAGKLQTLLLE